jgi:hypothetical protein
MDLFKLAIPYDYAIRQSLTGTSVKAAMALDTHFLADMTAFVYI